MQPNLALLKKNALAEIVSAASQAELEKIKVRYLGRKGELTAILRSLKDLAEEERRQTGKDANIVKNELLTVIDEKLKELAVSRNTYTLDLTLPGRKRFIGTKHPLTLVVERITEIFIGLGFEEILGPEIESEWYNFEALNIPEAHPSRGEMFGPFYLSDGWLLRSHTSPVQIRVMEKTKSPIRVIAPGRVYRRDAFDASHSPVFHQVEGLYVDKGVSFANLKGVLEKFCQEMFGADIKTQLTPSYFPFTEPSAELSISCTNCAGEGCRVCKQTGWLEILGCGMVHPQVLRNVGYNPDEVTGYAFGMGIERIAMIKYKIDDIRHFFTNDLRFLRQFREI